MTQGQDGCSSLHSYSLESQAYAFHFFSQINILETINANKIFQCHIWCLRYLCTGEPRDKPWGFPKAGLVHRPGAWLPQGRPSNSETSIFSSASRVLQQNSAKFLTDVQRKQGSQQHRPKNQVWSEWLGIPASWEPEQTSVVWGRSACLHKQKTDSKTWEMEAATKTKHKAQIQIKTQK